MAKALRLRRVGYLGVTGVTGTTEEAPVFAAIVWIAGRPRSVEMVGLGGEAIVGRDLLSGLVVRLDGPGARLSIASPEP